MDDSFISRIADSVETWVSLYDSCPDVVFFVKDAKGRYAIVNRALAERCGVRSKSQLIGKTTADLFPPPLGKSYLDQDLKVVRKGTAMQDKLELHVYPGGFQGWCVTTKLPLHDASGKVIGLAGVSRDIHMRADRSAGYDEFAATIQHIRRNYDQQLRVSDLAKMAGLSVYQYDKRMKKVLGISAGTFISRVRLEESLSVLKNTKKSIADVALTCGFYDQSAFARAFKSAIGMTPSEYRKHAKA